jgi:hypothetical protein
VSLNAKCTDLLVQPLFRTKGAIGEGHGEDSISAAVMGSTHKMQARREIAHIRREINGNQEIKAG